MHPDPSRYYGDVELVRAAIGAVSRQDGKACPAEFSRVSQGTYEPYALVVSRAKDPEFPARFSRAIYGMFEDGSLAGIVQEAFTDEGLEMSEYLQLLYRVSRIPAGVRGMEQPKYESVTDSQQ